MLEYPKDIGTGLVPVSRFVPCRTFHWRHIYGSLKTSHWDLPLVPAPFFCHYSRSHIWSRSPHVASPLTCRLLAFMLLHPPFVITYPRTEPAFRKHHSFLAMLSCVCSLSKDLRFAPY